MRAEEFFFYNSSFSLAVARSIRDSGIKRNEEVRKKGKNRRAQGTNKYY